MKVIIIGGVAGGASAAARLRRLDENAEIILIERGEHISYANCGLPYYLGRVITERDSLLVMTPENFKARFNVDVRIRCEAIAINRFGKTVTLRDRAYGAQTTETYDKLILATGASPVNVDMPGAELPGVFHLWTLADMDKLDAYLDASKKKIAVVGGGFVGIELAESLRERGLEVTLIQRGGKLLPSLDYEMSNYLITALNQQGIDVKMDTRVESLSSRDGGLKATVGSGEELSADVVVFCIGVQPNSELARKADLSLGKRGHIVTDEFLRTSDADIYAVGDVIEVNDPILNVKIAIALAGPANRQGRIAANNIAGISSRYRGTLGTSVIKVGRMTAASVGYTEERLKDAKIEFYKIYLHPGSNASYYPGGAQLHIKMLFGKDGKIYGAQIVGMKGADKRIDVIATAMINGMKIQDLAGLELAYAPPYSSAKDPVNLAGMIGENIVSGLAGVAHFDSLPKGARLLDVREAEEFEAGTVPGAVNMPLGTVRQRLGELPRDRRIFVFCQSGLRGYVAVRILQQRGFNAVNISGGYLTWKMFQKVESSVHFGAESPKASCSVSAAARTIDARALACPGPVIRLKKEFDQLKPGESLEMLAPLSFESDLKGWIKSGGSELLSLENKDDYLKAVIRKTFGDEKQPSVVAGNIGQGGAIVLFSNDLDKAMAALIIACGMAAAGKQVGIFFTFWGLSVLRKDPAPLVQKTFMSSMFGWMLPKGAGHLALSKMNMGGMGTLMMKKVMAEQNVTPLPELLAQARALGVKFVACEMAMGVMGISREELIEVDDVAGVASFVAMAGQGNATLFI